MCRISPCHFARHNPRLYWAEVADCMVRLLLSPPVSLPLIPLILIQVSPSTFPFPQGGLFRYADGECRSHKPRVWAGTLMIAEEGFLRFML